MARTEKWIRIATVTEIGYLKILSSNNHSEHGAGIDNHSM